VAAFLAITAYKNHPPEAETELKRNFAPECALVSQNELWQEASEG